MVDGTTQTGPSPSCSAGRLQPCQLGGAGGCCTAGSVAHVYRALARAAGVDSPHPEEVLLLAEVRNGLLSELHTDPKASAPEPFVTMMYSSHPTPPFLAYLYPDAARGPRAPGLRRVHVMHRCALRLLQAEMKQYAICHDVNSRNSARCSRGLVQPLLFDHGPAW